MDWALLLLALLRRLKSILARLASVLRVDNHAPGAGLRPIPTSRAARQPRRPIAQCAVDGALHLLALLRRLKCILALHAPVLRFDIHGPGAAAAALPTRSAARPPRRPIAQRAMDWAL